MADYTFTADSVVFAGSGRSTYIAGEAMTAGILFYISTADNKAYKADCDDADDYSKAILVGIALNAAAAGQPFHGVSEGTITVGTAIFASAGLLLVLSGAPGKCCDHDDLAAGDHVTIVGWSLDEDTLYLCPKDTETELPVF